MKTLAYLAIAFVIDYVLGVPLLWAGIATLHSQGLFLGFGDWSWNQTFLIQFGAALAVASLLLGHQTATAFVKEFNGG
jgi:hypothetical protein